MGADVAGIRPIQAKVVPYISQAIGNKSKALCGTTQARWPLRCHTYDSNHNSRQAMHSGLQGPMKAQSHKKKSLLTPSAAPSCWPQATPPRRWQAHRHSVRRCQETQHAAQALHWLHHHHSSSDRCQPRPVPQTHCASATPCPLVQTRGARGGVAALADCV